MGRIEGEGKQSRMEGAKERAFVEGLESRRKASRPSQMSVSHTRSIMSDDGTKLSMKEKLFDFMVSASNAVSKTSNVSTFATTGKLTPEEVRKHLSTHPVNLMRIIASAIRFRGEILTLSWFERRK